MSHHPVGESLPLAISYYQLYCDIAAAADDGDDETTTTADDDDEQIIQQEAVEEESKTRGGAAAVSGDGNNTADQLQQMQQPPQQFWVDEDADEWDAAREAAAERELRENWERCRIPAAAAARGVASDNSKITNNNQHRNHHDSRSSSNSSNADCWDRFYQRHRTNFFKDRHWPARAFPNEFGRGASNTDGGRRRRRVLVEVGCGVGNTLLPLLEQDGDEHEPQQQQQQPPNNNREDDTAFSSSSTSASSSSLWTVYGLDLSPTALELLRRDERFRRAVAADQQQQSPRAFAAVADISQPNSVPPNFVGVATVTSLLFCLSAIAPEHHGAAVRNALATLDGSNSNNGSGGVVVVRDYGIYDEAQMKLGRQRHKLVSENYYRKHDGTCCYYFTVERIRELFLSHNNGNDGDDDDDCTVIEELECRYIRRVYTNRSDQTQRRRVWVQARFRKTTKKLTAALVE